MQNLVIPGDFKVETVFSGLPFQNDWNLGNVCPQQSNPRQLWRIDQSVQ